MDYRVSINLIVSILLLAVYTNAFKMLDSSDKIHHSFMRLLELAIFLILCEIFSSIYHIDLFKIILFICMPFYAYLALVFIKRWINVNFKLSIKGRLIVLLPTIVNMIVIFLNIDNIHNMYLYTYGLSLFYLVAVLYVLIEYRQIISAQDNLIALLLIIPPCLLGLVQYLFSFYSFVYVINGLLLVYIYILVQQRLLQTDELTGAWSRAAFEQYIEYKIHRKNIDLSIVYIDLDDFKKINDTYGHAEGDLVLRKVVKILQKTFESHGKVVRLGGDEFIVIINQKDRKIIRDLIQKMNADFDYYNSVSRKDYTIRYSYGFDTYDSKKQPIHDFLECVDEMMYFNKKNKKVNEDQKMVDNFYI